MNISDQPKLLFHGIEVIDTLYSSRARYDRDVNIPVELNIIPKVFYPRDKPNAFHIIMEVKISVVEYFDLTLVAIGHFELNGEITSEIRSTFINTNAPAIMFPYMRSFISTFTSNVGLSSGTLIIPPQFFSGTLEALEEDSSTE